MAFITENWCEACGKRTPHVYTDCQRCIEMKDVHAFNKLSAIQRDTYLLKRIDTLEALVLDQAMTIASLRKSRNKHTQ